MGGTTASMPRKIDTVGNPRLVVRTMQALAGLSIGQFEQRPAPCATGVTTGGERLFPGAGSPH